MTKMILIIVLTVVAIAMAFFSVALYMNAYKKRVNNAFNNQKDDVTNAKPMMTPFRFVITALLSLLGLFLVVIIISAVAFAVEPKSVNTSPKVYSVFMTESEINNSPFEGYTFGEDIKGYVKKEVEKGDIRFVYYTLDGRVSDIFPIALVAIKYNGSKDIKSVFSYFAFTDNNYSETQANTYYLDEDTDYSENGLYAISSRDFMGKITLDYFFSDKEINVTGSDIENISEKLAKQGVVHESITIDLESERR